MGDPSSEAAEAHEQAGRDVVQGWRRFRWFPPDISVGTTNTTYEASREARERALLATIAELSRAMKWATVWAGASAAVVTILVFFVLAWLLQP